MGRRAGSRLAGIVTAFWMAVGMGLGVAPEVDACTSAPVPFQRIVDRAPVIFFVTVASRATSGGAPTAYTLVVREALRGAPPNDAVLPAVIRLVAPPVSACGDVLDVPISSHLVLALEVPAFDDGQPLAAAWVIRPDGSLEGGWDDGPSSWADMDALRTALAGGAIATPDPSVTDPTPAPSLDNEPPIASIGILIGLLVGVAMVVAFALIGRRGPRATRSGDPDPPER